MRIAIVGVSGSGKTTLARKAATRLDIPHIEIDAVHHLAGWEPNPNFVADMAHALDVPDWVCDGNYHPVEEIVRGAADVIVCFDLPRRQVMRQVVTRTLRRSFTREELWNGNRESATNLLRWDPERNIIRWAWVYHRRRLERMRASEQSGAWDHAQVIWVQSHAEADAWLDSLPSPRVS